MPHKLFQYARHAPEPESRPPSDCSFTSRRSNYGGTGCRPTRRSYDSSDTCSLACRVCRCGGTRQVIRSAQARDCRCSNNGGCGHCNASCYAGHHVLFWRRADTCASRHTGSCHRHHRRTRHRSRSDSDGSARRCRRDGCSRRRRGICASVDRFVSQLAFRAGARCSSVGSFIHLAGGPDRAGPRSHYNRRSCGCCACGRCIDGCRRGGSLPVNWRSSDDGGSGGWSDARSQRIHDGFRRARTGYESSRSPLHRITMHGS